MIQTFLLTSWGFLREFAEVALVGFFIAGLINAAINKETVARRLGRNIVWANALASVWGFVTPLCCCSGVPTAMSLYRFSNRRGPTCAFLISVPWFNWYGLIALVVFLGWVPAIIVSLSAVVVGFIAGLAIDTTGDPSPVMRISGSSSCCESGEADRSTDAPLVDFSNPAEKIRSGIRFAIGLLRELGPWMIAGIVLGAAIEAIVPRELVTTYLGKASVWGVLVALVIAGAFYTDSLASLPWVRTLLDKGLGVGSGMILLVAGVGTNLSTLAPVARVMGARTAIIYASSVVVLTGVIGYLLNALL
jgi:uncharacterized membrane protein YraQ (UPF0718 family)